MLSIEYKVLIEKSIHYFSLALPDSHNNEIYWTLFQCLFKTKA
jgi:hypothetical protein